MDIWSPEWASWVLVEAFKFWVYSLCFSLVSSFLQLYHLSASKASVTDSPEKEGKQSMSGDGKIVAEKTERKATRVKRQQQQQALAKQIIVDCCDLLVPGFVTGWLRTTPAVVGMVSVVSTVLTSKDIWDRVQREAL